MAGHEITNQSPVFEGHNAFLDDLPLREALRREGASTRALARLEQVGAWCGSSEGLEQARLSNRHQPELRTHDAKGRRLDVVEFHPAYHALMARSTGFGLASAVAEARLKPAQRASSPHVERAAAFYMMCGLEAGHCCPLTMTSAAVSALAQEPELAEVWLPRIAVRAYDPASRPAETKAAVTLGMGLTEKQGGTDVRANITRAVPAGSLRAYVLDGHKWFLSAPMSDAFLVLAQAAAGPTAFLVPRLRPDGTLNGLRVQRLKDKLGNRSNASAEVEIEGALGERVGEEGRGIATIIEMITATRLDCALGSAGLMRVALAEAVHHARHRHVFGKPLISEPLMATVLADLALDVEAALALTMRLARAFDRASDPRAAAWARLMTPVTKYYVCKIAPPMIGEAMECLGGNGYVEESRLPRLYREAPVNSIWEGSGNVMALDLLRVLKREPDQVETVIGEIREAASGDTVLKSAVARVEAMLHDPVRLDAGARQLAEAIARLAAAAILRSSGPATVADAFVRGRLDGTSTQTYGQGLEPGDVAQLLGRVLPAV